MQFLTLIFFNEFVSILTCLVTRVGSFSYLFPYSTAAIGVIKGDTNFFIFGLTKLSTHVIMCGLTKLSTLNMEINMSFGKLLRNLRSKKGVSIKKLAAELNLDYTYISKLENSKVTPSAEIANRFAKYFRYDSDELLLAAGKLPKDIAYILKSNPKGAADFLRRKFSASSYKQ